MPKKKTYVVAGGTFDHFHKGHELFLKTALEAGDNLVIGITSDKMVKEKPFSHSIESFSVRKANVERFVYNANNKRIVTVVKLENPFGLSVTDQKMDKIIVTRETKPNAKIINIIRKKNRLKALKIVVVPYVYADDKWKISSLRVRNGVISRQGKSYIKFLFSKKIYRLPNTLRTSLREPLGRVFLSKNDVNRFVFGIKRQKDQNIHIKYVYTVGDIASLTFIDSNVIPSLIIYDHMTQREALSVSQKKRLHYENKITIINQAGTIRQRAIFAINAMLKKTVQTGETYSIKVIGEEDLLVLPMILMAPLGSVVCYGQRNLGFIAVTVTETIKQKVKELLQKFS